MKRPLLLQAFLAMLAVSLLSVALAGLITRIAFGGAFSRYLAALPVPRAGMGAGRRLMLGVAERTFLSSVDTGLLVGAIVAIALAAAAALAAAYYLTRPIERLTDAAHALAGGDLSHRVDPGGPAEIAGLGGAFNAMADSLEESEELRRRLVADVAHELRNPIAALRAQAEGIAEGVLAPDPARLASLAEDTRHLSRLVADLQELSAAEAGRLGYEMQDLDLAQVACAEAERARVLAAPGVEVRCDAAAPVSVRADEGRVAQVMRNLLGNALRHTTSGSVTVRCSLDGSEAVVEVADTGDGIPPADLPYVFERFYRADAARARDTGGSGIGLAVSKRIVEDHGGTVFARNLAEGGAAVGFRIPLSR